MGQTLSNGVYLPNEGERNCYAGLASNWQILNTAVGNIAEKAPLVHTHGNITNDGKVGTTANLPLITGTGGAVQAGSFGTSANTFCEGNDSRLSDARTPVAHTHGKADVTDLLNSNFIPSANNSYDLGSSSYQWNNLYAKNYYYNGTAWGLDKDNQWLKNQSFIGEQLGTEDSANTNTCLTLYGRYDTVQSSGMIFTRMRSNSSQGGLNDNAASRLGIDVLENGVRTTNALLVNIKGYNSETGLFTRCELCTALASSRLGTSSNPWKFINDVNPGALSLPSSDSTDYIDLSSNLSTNAEYQYTAPYDGWLCLYVIVNEFYQENAVGLYRSDTSANSHQWAKSVTAALNLNKQNKYQGSVMLPVESGKKYICYLSLNANTTIHNKFLFFYKNKGNV